MLERGDGEGAEGGVWKWHLVAYAQVYFKGFDYFFLNFIIYFKKLNSELWLVCENLVGRGLFRLACHTYAFCRKAFVGRRFLPLAPTHPWTLLIHSWDFTDYDKISSSERLCCYNKCLKWSQHAEHQLGRRPTSSLQTFQRLKDTLFSWIIICYQSYLHC